MVTIRSSVTRIRRPTELATHVHCGSWYFVGLTAGWCAFPFPPTYDGPRLAALMNERGVVSSELHEAYLGPEEGPDSISFRQVLKDALGTIDGGVMVYYGSGTSQKATVQFAAGLSKAYFRAVAKVAFHYYLWTSTSDTGAEFRFQPIREFIRHGVGDSESFVQIMAPQFIAQLANGDVPKCFGHFFGVSRTGRHDLIGAVQFFVGPDHMMPPSFVLLTQTQRSVEPRCHWVAYYGAKVDNYDGEIQPLSVGSVTRPS